MSIRRLLGTAAAMAVGAAGLRAVTPDPSRLTAAGLDLQRAVDIAGAETVLLAGVAALAWAAWLWGALGLLLTALSALPGAAGALARALTRCLLPAGARRAAALALGVGLATGGPLLAGCGSAPAQPPTAVTPAAATSIPGSVPDWPAARGSETDRTALPGRSPTGRHRRRERAQRPSPTGRHPPPVSRSSSVASVCGTSPPTTSGSGRGWHRQLPRWPRPCTPGGGPTPT